MYVITAHILGLKPYSHPDNKKIHFYVCINYDVTVICFDRLLSNLWTS